MAIYQYKQQVELNLFFALFIGLRFISLAIIYLFREAPKKESSKFQQVFAYIGAVIPFLYSSNNSTHNPILWSSPFDLSLLTISGSMISLWGILSLGKSFAITPSQRSIVTSGAYRILKHPIYTGYFITELAVILTFFSVLNCSLFLTSLFLYIVRSKWEEKILNQL